MTIYRDIWDGPSYATVHGMTYGAAKKRYIVIHSTENTASAEDESSYAKRRTDGVSSHYYADKNKVLQSTDTNTGANHVGSMEGNKYGIAYEVIGLAKWTRETWKRNVQLVKLAAAIARDCARWDIPIVHGSVADLKAHKPGIYTHHDFTRAIGGTDHTDPGTGFPLDLLIDLTKGEKDMDYTDDVVKNPTQRGDSDTNPTVQLGFYLNDSYQKTYDLRDAVKDLTDKVEELESKVGATYTFTADQFAQLLAAVKE